VPAHRRLRELLRALGTALTATSANRSGRPALTEPDEVLELLAASRGAVLVDDGPLPGGAPSTLVGVRDGRLEVLRQGALPMETLAAALDDFRGRGFSAASVEILADESR
jgi:L-threonylcarbamoyladenylate synthase